MHYNFYFIFSPFGWHNISVILDPTEGLTEEEYIEMLLEDEKKARLLDQPHPSFPPQNEEDFIDIFDEDIPTEMTS